MKCDRVYFWCIFYPTGHRAWKDLPHIPVTSLVKYPPPPELSLTLDSCLHRFKIPFIKGGVQFGGQLEFGKNCLYDADFANDVSLNFHFCFTQN